MRSYNLNIYYIKHKIENKESYFLDDNIGIIKNYEKCINNKNFMISDLHSLNNTTKLKVKDNNYYLEDDKYLSEEEYKKYAKEYFDKIRKGSYSKKYAVLKHTGKYDTIYETYNKLLKILKEENIQIDGLPMEQFIIGRWNEEDENKYVTNIMVPIKEK